MRPAVPQFHYGYERITFFSAGFEGAMIVLAAGSIIFTTTQKWRHGLAFDHLGNGVILVLAGGVMNAFLGWYLLRLGRRNHSLILEADGKHVLTDSWTSFGVVAGLALVMMTGWKPFDPLVAFAIAASILWSGGRLMWNSTKGLLDYPIPRSATRFAIGSMPYARNWGCITTGCVSAPQAIDRLSRFTCCFLTRWEWAKHTGSRPCSKSA
jgi:cation diffusion facilitator family transporter